MFIIMLSPFWHKIVKIMKTGKKKKRKKVQYICISVSFIHSMLNSVSNLWESLVFPKKRTIWYNLVFMPYFIYLYLICIPYFSFQIGDKNALRNILLYHLTQGVFIGSGFEPGVTNILKTIQGGKLYLKTVKC